MTWRPRSIALRCMVALIAAVSVSPIDTQTQPPKRRVWNGTVIEERAFSYGGRIRPVSGEVAEYFHNIRVNFRYVEEALPSGGWRSVSQHISWTGRGRSDAPGYETTVCNGADSFDLITTPSADVARRLTIPCITTRHANFFGFFREPPDRVNVPALVREDQLRDNCSFAEERPGYKYSVWLGEDYDAVVEVDTGPDSEYARFAPAPGRGLQMSVRTEPATPSLFRFVLQRDEVSRFPGYATNAVVNDEFLEEAGMSHLRGWYNNEDPDWIFDERNFENRELWGVVGPGEVQTTTLETSATVTVTAMDYGAAGKLRAYVKGRCGGWQPARFAVGGQSRAALALPFDEDGNLIADALSEYAGKTERDDDEEPKGNGFSGDGLTAFEEYRGFATRGGDCANRRHDFVVRTDPRRKDLFIHAPDPELAASTAHFEWASGVAVHLICEPHYVNNKQRVVNFTLQRDGLREWNGNVVSQRAPQHGLFINDQEPPFPWFGGIACVNPPTCTAGDTGPPQHTAIIMIPKPRILKSGGVTDLVQTTTHEIGHGVGIAHHSDSVQEDFEVVVGRLNFPEIEWGARVVPFLIEPGPACADPRASEVPDADMAVPVYLDGAFIGCAASRVAVRGGQNSGNAECPMRYVGGEFYEAPGSTAAQRGYPEVNQQGNPQTPIPGGTRRVKMYSGKMLPYQNHEDFEPLGRFCTSKTGTLLNAAERGDLNHAGDAAVGRCQDHIVINDLVLLGK